MDVDAIKERNRVIWGLGDYRRLSEALRPAAEALADACAVSAGQEVLDVAAGDGNFALACAREGASVVASDLSPGMVERGRARSEAEGYEIEWVEADVEALPFEDGRFDCVGSVFGAMIAPRPRVVAEELFRVVRPGGTVGHDRVDPEGFTAELFALGRSYAPPAPTGRCPTSGRWRRTCASASTAWPPASSSRRAQLVWQAESPEELVADARHLGAALGGGEAEPAARALGVARRRRRSSWPERWAGDADRSSSRTSTP